MPQILWSIYVEADSSVTGIPLFAPTPADRTRVAMAAARAPSSPVRERSESRCRAIASAIGDRHVFPVHTNRTD